MGPAYLVVGLTELLFEVLLCSACEWDDRAPTEEEEVNKVAQKGANTRSTYVMFLPKAWNLSMFTRDEAFRAYLCFATRLEGLMGIPVPKSGNLEVL